MPMILRALAAALLALWLAIPGKSGEGDGGENAGGTGVWILPRCECIASNAAIGTAQPREAPFAIPDLAHDVKLRLSNECGMASGTLFDGSVGTEFDLPVNGQYVILPATLLQALFSARVPTADIVIMDAAHRGYRLRLHIDLVTARADLLVY